MRRFDLNIETILDNWTIGNAIREIIANAIDEQYLTKTKAISIYQDIVGRWHIRDYGRGLKYAHFTQNENQEKTEHSKVIGKFGVGLKDALATFDRHGIKVAIDSKYGHFTLDHSSKYGFEEIATLHVCVDGPICEEMQGTDFCIEGCSANDIQAAKDSFICFAGVYPIETTKYGEIYKKIKPAADIFVNGIKVAEEDNFLFSYNITPINKLLKKELNRERTNVGRSAYSGRVREMLLNACADEVIQPLIENFSMISSGRQCDELKWTDVLQHAAKLLNERKKVVFVTSSELTHASNTTLEIIKRSGRDTMIVPNPVKDQLEGARDNTGSLISTIKTVVAAENASFDYHFIPYEQLSVIEKKTFDLMAPTLSFFSSRLSSEQIFIAEELKREDGLGVYERNNDRIIISRKQLRSSEAFLGTLIHELAHVVSGYSDLCREFENQLTTYLGILASKVIGETDAPKGKNIPMNASAESPQADPPLIVPDKAQVSCGKYRTEIKPGELIRCTNKGCNFMNEHIELYEFVYNFGAQMGRYYVWDGLCKKCAERQRQQKRMESIRIVNDSLESSSI